MFSLINDKVNTTKWQKIDWDDNKSETEDNSDNELPISSITNINDINNITKRKEIEVNGIQSDVENYSDYELPISSIVTVNDNIASRKLQKIDFDDFKSDIEYYSDNELPISSIADVLLPSDNTRIVQSKELLPELIDHQSKLNAWNHDSNSEIRLKSGIKQSIQDNQISNYECDVCGKVFHKRTKIIEHFRSSLCFPEIPSNLINNNSFNQEFCKNPNVKLHFKNINNIVTNNMKATYKCKICQIVIKKPKLIKEHQILHTTEYYLKCNQNSKLNRITSNKHNYIHPKNPIFVCDNNNKSYLQLNTLKQNKVINLFGCHICQERFSERESLMEHKRIHDLKNVNQCDICLKYLNSKSSVSKHICRIPSLTQEYECSRCSEVFFKRSEIVNHIFKNHQEDYSKYSCETCSKVYEFSNNSFYSLKKSCFKCDVCSRSFTTSHRLDQHYRWHLNINDFSCRHCSQKFSTFSVYLSHEKTHVGEKPFRCNFCGKWFPVSSNINIHVGFNNTFVCKFCKKNFSQKSLLLSHEKIHLQREQSKSMSFSKLFNQLSNFKLCSQQKCTSKKQYKCNKCDETFIQSSTLRTHLQTHIIKSFQQNNDSCNINSKLSLINYKTTHINNECFQCDLCQETFFDQNIFTTHTCSPGKNSPTSFKINHKKMHKNNKLFKCDVCFTTFMHSTSLNRHKRRHINFEKNLPCDSHESKTDNFVNEGFKCDLCMEIFDNQTQICAHILENHY